MVDLTTIYEVRFVYCICHEFSADYFDYKLKYDLPLIHPIFIMYK